MLNEMTTRDISCHGLINLKDAHFPGTLILDARRLSNVHGIAVDLSGAVVGIFRLKGAPQNGAVDLTDTSVRVMLDDPKDYAGRDGLIILNGLSYSKIHTNGVEIETRLDWLRSGTCKVRAPDSGYAHPETKFVAQPWEQLASIYRGSSDNKNARYLLLNKHRQINSSLHWRTNWFWRVLNYIQDATIGYGYAPRRAFVWVATLWIAGSVYFGLNHPAPTKDRPPFNMIDAVGYSLDLLMPVVGIGAKDAWYPVGNVGKVLAITLIVSGWLLGFTIIAGIARIARE